MDLLASYSDDGDSAKNTPTSDRSEQMMPKLDAVQSDASLQAEWESFEKMIAGAEEPASVPPPMTVAYPILSSQVQTNIPNTDSYSDPPVLTNMKDADHVDMFESDDKQANKNVPQISNSGQPPKLTDITLAPEFNTDSMYGEMPTLTKITGSSPEHSSSRSSSSSRSRSRSRSHSVDSDKSEPEHGEQKSEPEQDKKKKATSPTELPAAFKKDLSPCRSSTSHKKSEKREKRSRSRSRSPRRRRRRSSDRKRSHSRSPGRRKSSDKKRRSRSRDKRSRRSSSRSRHRRRSHSRSRRRSSRERRSSRDRHRRRGSRERRRERKNRHRRSHSRDRHRSPSRSRSRSRERPRATGGHKEKHLTFKEKMRQQLLKASKILTDKEGAGPSDLELPKEKPSSLPLSAANIFSSISSSGSVTPQMALLQTMAAMHQKAQEMTGVAVPKYYNPAAVNPLKYAEQVQKRKLLWSKNKEKKEDEGQWQSTAFVQDQDGKMAAKFRKLMGMKEDEEKTDEVDEEKARETEEKKKKTEEMFYRLDKEYEFARMTTHTQRGVGLGFHSQGFPNP